LKSNALDTWLLGYEFPETIIVFMHKQIHVVCSHKKAGLIETLKNAANTVVGVDIVLHVKTKSDDGPDLMDVIVQAVRNESKSDKPVVGYIAKEVPQGKLLESWTKKLSGSVLQLADVTDGFSELFAVKDTTEVTFVKKSAYLTSSVLKHFVVPKLEKVIKNEKKVSHSSLMNDIEKVILNPLKVKVKLKPDDIDICYRPIFQSGSKFDLKPGASSNDDCFYCGSASVIICAIGSKYNSYCSNVARTYLIDATPTQSKTYETLLKAHEAAVEQVKPGNQMSAVYQAAVAVIEKDAPELLPNLTELAGSGMGLEFRESFLDLNTENGRGIKEGMVFNVSLGLRNVLDQAEIATCAKAKKFSLLLADTILVTARGNKILTIACSKAVKHISYWFNKDALKTEHMKHIMSMKENIRHIGIFAPGQPILEALLSEPRLLVPEINHTTARGDGPMSLYYQMDEDPKNTFLVNVTHFEDAAVLSSEIEFNASLSCVDGALIGVRLEEGFTIESESFLQ
jgi:nucleosome binding factor SPN SPT16 subunit